MTKTSCVDFRQNGMTWISLSNGKSFDRCHCNEKDTATRWQTSWARGVQQQVQETWTLSMRILMSLQWPVPSTVPSLLSFLPPMEARSISSSWFQSQHHHFLCTRQSARPTQSFPKLIKKNNKPKETWTSRSDKEPIYSHSTDCSRSHIWARGTQTRVQGVTVTGMYLSGTLSTQVPFWSSLSRADRARAVVAVSAKRRLLRKRMVVPEIGEMRETFSV